MSGLHRLSKCQFTPGLHRLSKSLVVGARAVSPMISKLLPKAVYARDASHIQVSVYSRAASPIQVSVCARAASHIQESGC